MPTHGFQTPIWVETLFGKQGPILPTRQTSATVTQATSDNGNNALPRTDVLLHGRNIARRTIQSSPTPMQPLPVSGMRELHSSTALSTAIEFESLATYIDRGSRYGRYGTNPPKRLVDLEAGGFTYMPKRSQSLTQRLKVGFRQIPHYLRARPRHWFPHRWHQTQAANVQLLDNANTILW